MTTLRILYLSNMVAERGLVHAQGSAETQDQLLDIVQAALANVSHSYKLLSTKDLTDVIYAETVLKKVTAVYYSKERFKSIQGRIKRYRAMQKALNCQVFSQKDVFAQRLSALRLQAAALHNAHKVALFTLKLPNVSVDDMLGNVALGSLTPAFSLAFDAHFALCTVPTRAPPEPYIYILKA